MKSIKRAKIGAAGMILGLSITVSGLVFAAEEAAKKESAPVKKVAAEAPAKKPGKAVEPAKKAAPEAAVAEMELKAPAAIVKEAAPAKMTAAQRAREILKKTVQVYTAAPSYETGFYLQQPRTPGEVDDGELMMKLREKYRLLYRRGRSGADSDAVRLEGAHGTNQGTTAVWTPGGKFIIVYRPRYGAQKVAKNDKRIKDFFTLDMKYIAEDMLNVAGDKNTRVTVGEEQCPKYGLSGGAQDCYTVSLSGQLFGAIAYINKDTSLMEMIEYQRPDKKGNLYLTRRLTWFSFKKRDVKETEITAKPVHKD